MTGTAELVAEEVGDEFDRLGHAFEVVPMDGLDGTVFDEDAIYLICTSTYGQGDVPDNAMALYDDLSENRRDLSAVHYGVIALGDRTYADTFCHGGQLFDTLLSALGARRIGAMLEHDASDGSIPEEAALEWSRSWIDLITTRNAAA